MSRAARLFRDQEHVRTIWVTGDAWGAPQNDGDVYTVVEVTEATYDFDVFRWLEGPEAAIAGLTPENGDVLYSGDYFYRYDPEGAWIPIPRPPGGLYAKAVEREDNLAR